MANEDVQKTLAELSRDLQESKARLEEAQRVAHVGHWEWDLGTDVVVWSDETYRIFGLSPQERPMDLATVRAMVHPEDRESLYRGVDEDLVGGVRPDAEFRIVRPNGEVRTVHSVTPKRWSSMPGDAKRDASGRPYKLFGTVQDITDRRRAEEALKQSQFYLREGQRLAHMGSWASNDLGIRWSDDLGIYWSEEVYKIYGLDPQNGAPNLEQYLASIHPDDRASMAETIRVMHEQRCGCDVTKRIVRPDGEVRYVRCVGVPVFEGGVFKAFHGTAMDVTEQELLTQELRREQAYLTEAQSLTHIGSWACNLVTREIFHSSDENARLYGFDPGEGAIPFDRFYNSILKEDELALRPKLENSIRAGADYDVEFRIRRTDGAIRFLRGIGHHNPSQEIGEYVGITMDMTERKRAEEEREKLRQLEADLAHINRVSMMGEMAASLAHEIKQPITAAVMNAQACLRLLERNEPNIVKAHEAAFGMAGCATRAAEIIDRVRSLFGKNAPEHEAVDVNEVIRDIVVLLQNEARRHSIIVHTELAEDLPRVMGDQVQLQQVLMNLMLNGIESMRDVPGELRITSGQVDEREVLISVSDTGVGLPAEKLDQIFNAFFTTKPQGTGMGLAISRSIIESHGGRLWAEANNGRGAIFRFTLPQQTPERA
jgi:PAS domain S-box-containing protein